MNLLFFKSASVDSSSFPRLNLRSTTLFLWVLSLCSIINAQPAQDPVYDGPPIGLIDGLEAKHPRLLFDSQRLEEIKAYYNAEENAAVREALSSQAEDVRNAIFSTTINDSEGGSKNFGTYRIPTLALHFLLTGDQDSLDSAIAHLDFLARLDPWSAGNETNTGMPAGNLLAGAALGYDMLYDHLETRLRDSLRGKIWQQARTMYYRGFLDSGNSASGYWRGDPQNNHRFHRLGGFVLGTLVAYDGDPSQDWLLSKAIEELNFVINYLPPDGSNHEGIGYINYGHRLLLLAAWGGERNLGKPYLATPYIKNTPLFITAASTPGFNDRFRYADDSGGGILSSEQKLPILYNQLADVQAVVDAEGAGGTSWWTICIHQEKATGGSIDNLPKNVRFPDIGVSFFHEGWEAGQVAAMFKCGPMGGKRLNEYRDENNFHYINIAHDDPDANTFVIWGGTSFSVQGDGYAHDKRTSSHNSILVNNRGQSTEGRSEGGQWSQPATTNTSMQKMAYMTNWKNAGSIALAEGEAEGSYPTTPLSRFRRAFIWNEGKYILIFDDIRASSNVSISWLIQSSSMTIVSESEGEFISGAGRGNTPNPFKFIANQPVTFTSGISTADDRGGSLALRQLKADFTNIQNLQIATLHRLWDDSLNMSLEFTDNDHATITITGPDFEDVWTWTAASDNNSAGQFILSSTSEQTFDSTSDPWLEIFPGFSYESGAWTVSDWFGHYSPKHFPWIYSARHGWIYSAQSSEWFWTPQFGWVWTRNDYYPWFYQYSESNWIYQLSDAG